MLNGDLPHSVSGNIVKPDGDLNGFECDFCVVAERIRAGLEWRLPEAAAVTVCPRSFNSLDRTVRTISSSSTTSTRRDTPLPVTGTAA